MGVASQTTTGTGTPASLATPPTTVHPVRQTSMAAAQHLKSQRSINTPATATPPKVRPQSRNLLLDSADTNFSGSQSKTRQTQQQQQQQPPQQQTQQQQEAQLSVTDSPAPGLPYQTSSAKENQTQPAAAEESTDTPTKSTKKPQSQLQPPQQHLLKPVVNKQVSLHRQRRHKTKPANLKTFPCCRVQVRPWTHPPSMNGQLPGCPTCHTSLLTSRVCGQTVRASWRSTPRAWMSHG